MRRLVGLLCSALLFSVGVSIQAANPTLEVSYAHTETDYYRQRDAYFVEILHRALELSGRDFSLTPILLPQLKESRTRIYLRQGRYNIHWLVTNRDIEEQFIPIRIPLYKGLIGWRVFLIRTEDHARFNKSIQIEELKRIKSAQGHDWADYRVMQANNFNVISSPSSEGLFGMLKYKRIHYLPRSVTEIVNEYSTLNAPQLAIEKNLLLQYPLAYYFFVNRSHKDIAEAVENGLSQMLLNGEFDAIFKRTFAEKLNALHLGERKIFRLNNPYMHALTPPPNSDLWYDPHQEKITSK